MSQRSWLQHVGYSAARVAARIAGVLLFRVRVCGRRHIPAAGPVLVCSNHQSHFDPVLVGLACDRRMNYLARKTLFAFAPFRWLIEFFDAIPIDRDGFGLEGIKETLRRLRRGELVLIFPEGTRSVDGELSPLKPGVVALARRGGAPLLPVAIDGAYHAWPRTSRWPTPGVIHVVVGPPLAADEVAALGDEELLAELTRRIAACHAAARASRLRVVLGD